MLPSKNSPITSPTNSTTIASLPEDTDRGRLLSALNRGPTYCQSSRLPKHHQCTGAHPATGQLVIAAVHCVAFRVALDVRRAIEMCRAASGCIEVGVGLTAYLGARARAPERVGNTSLLRGPALSTAHVLARKRRCAHSVLCRASGPVRGRRSCAAAIVDSAGGRCAEWPSGLPLWGLDSSSRMYLIIHAVFFFAIRADASGLII